MYNFAAIAKQFNVTKAFVAVIAHKEPAEIHESMQRQSGNERALLAEVLAGNVSFIK